MSGTGRPEQEPEHRPTWAPTAQVSAPDAAAPTIGSAPRTAPQPLVAQAGTEPVAPLVRPFTGGTATVAPSTPATAPLSPYSAAGATTTSWGAGGIAASGSLAHVTGAAVRPVAAPGGPGRAQDGRPVGDSPVGGAATGVARDGLPAAGAGALPGWAGPVSPGAGDPPTGRDAGEPAAGAPGGTGQGPAGPAEGGPLAGGTGWGSVVGGSGGEGGGEGGGSRSRRPRWLVPLVAVVAVLVVAAAVVALVTSGGTSGAAPSQPPVPAQTIVLPSPTPTVAPAQRTGTTAFAKALPASVLQYAFTSEAPSTDWVTAGAVEAYTDTYSDGGSGTVTVIAGQFPSPEAASTFASTLTAALPASSAAPKASPTLPQSGDVEVGGAKAGTYTVVDAGDGTGVAVWTNGTTVFRATAPLADIASVYAAFPL